MVLQSSGSISCTDVVRELGISSNSAFSYSNLYGSFPGINVSGTLSSSNLYTKRNIQLTYSNLAYDLGGAGISPWNVTLADSNARFVWNVSTARTIAPGGSWALFQSTYFNKLTTMYPLILLSLLIIGELCTVTKVLLIVDIKDGLQLVLHVILCFYLGLTSLRCPHLMVQVHKTLR
jgi:hypothetical protein